MNEKQGKAFGALLIQGESLIGSALANAPDQKWVLVDSREFQGLVQCLQKAKEVYKVTCNNKKKTLSHKDVEKIVNQNPVEYE